MIRNKSGVTLIELLIVISVIAILTVSLGLSYAGWVGRYKVEKVTNDLYSDLMAARMEAVTNNNAHFVNLTAANYRITEDANSDEINNAGDRLLPTFPKTIEYPVTSSIPGEIVLARRGLVSPPKVVCLMVDPDTDPDYDCIILSETQVRTGKLSKSLMDGGVCGVFQAAPRVEGCQAK